MKILLREHDRWTKHYVFETSSGEAATFRPRREVSKVSGFAHRCSGGLVAVYKSPDPAHEGLVVQQRAVTLPIDSRTTAVWSSRALFLSRLSIETQHDRLLLQELVLWAAIFPERDWGLDPNFLHWLAGVLSKPEEFVAVWDLAPEELA